MESPDDTKNLSSVESDQKDCLNTDFNPIIDALKELGTAGITRWMEFTTIIGAATSVQKIGKITAEVAADITKAKSVRIFAFERLIGSHGEKKKSPEPIAEKYSFVDGVVLFPLRIKNYTFGVVEISGVDEKAQRFWPYIPPLVLALETQRLNRKRLRRENETKALAGLARQIGGTFKLETILEETLRFAVKTLRLERGLLVLFDEIRELTDIARTSFTYGFDQNISLDFSKQAFERLVIKGEPLVVNNVKTSVQTHAKSARELGAQAFVLIPLVARGRPLGIFYLDTTKNAVKIKERTLELGIAITEQAVIAIENARLYLEENRKRASAEALREIVLTLNSSLKLSVILEQILEHTRALVKASACAIFETRGNEIAANTAVGLETELIRQLRVQIGEGAMGKAVAEGRSVPIYDLRDDRYADQMALARRLMFSGQFPFLAMLALPLSSRGRIFGGLMLYFVEPQTFPEEEIATLELLAGHAAVALENARLFEEEVQREREAAVLLKVARLVSQSFEAKDVLPHVAAETCQALDLERCFFAFSDDILSQIYSHNIKKDDLPLDKKLLNKLSYIAESARAPIIFDFRLKSEKLQQFKILPDSQTGIITPLIARNEFLGFLYVDTTAMRAHLEQREAYLAAAIADQTALSIQNARLFETVKTQEAQYRQLAEGANDLIISIDLEGKITYANPAVQKTLGYSPQELIGQSYGEILTEESKKKATEAFEMLVSLPESRNSVIYDCVAIKSDGRLAHLEMNLNALKNDGQMFGTLSIARDLSEKRQLVEEIAKRGSDLAKASEKTIELRTFLSLFTQAQEEERRRIARELHDDTVQALITITRQVNKLENTADKAMRQDLVSIRENLNIAIDSVRRFARNLRPSVLDDLGLMPALNWLINQSITKTDIKIEGKQKRLSSDLELGIFRLVQESLTNIDKHARATKASIEVFFDNEGKILASKPRVSALIVKIKDDGAGFKQENVRDSDDHSGLGLPGMKERVLLLGGQMFIDSTPGNGTIITFWFPIEDRSNWL